MVGLDLLVCCVFAYYLMKHAPEIVGEAAQAFAAGLRGEEPEFAKRRRERLQEAGIDPAAGGAFRQYVGNRWRDFWLDQDRAAGKRRTGRPETGNASGRSRGLRDRLRDAWDAKVDDMAGRWRGRNAPAAPEDATPDPEPHDDAGIFDPASGTPDTETAPPTSASPGEQTTDETTPPAAGDDEPPVRVASTLGDLAPETTGPPAPPTTSEPVPAPTIDGGATGEPETRGGVATLVRPATTTEGNQPMSTAVATNGTAVTGVVSGAAEARSIQRYLESATEAYEAAMVNARKRIHQLGEQTVGVVQMATRSTVVDATAQAAESIAAAQAGANRCKAETIPLLGQVAREFDKRNS